MGRRVTVIGAGLAGWSAAITAARHGSDVTILEARHTPGGRARSQRTESGAVFNHGPHALYLGGATQRFLDELGIRLGGAPASPHAWGRWAGRIDRLPGTPGDALRSRLLGMRATAELARRIARTGRLARSDLSGSMQDWIDREFTHPAARATVAMSSRTATYVADHRSIAADAAVPQMVSALSVGVRYLDGGWQSIVDALAAEAGRTGVSVRTDDKVAAFDDVARGADAIVIATGGPRHAASFLGTRSAAVERWAHESYPVHLTSIDLHLSSLPVAHRRIVLALDAPLYFSVHTPAARLADHGEVAHVAWYGDSGSGDVESACEGFLDEVQPGWRDRVLTRRTTRRAVVTHGVPRPGAGLAGRPGPTVPDLDDVYVAGDWVGPHGLLADASVSSGIEAGHLAARPRR
jgi:phytoene dehydrogenase-like protein